MNEFYFLERGRELASLGRVDSKTNDVHRTLDCKI